MSRSTNHLASIVRRGQAMRAFCAGVRSRGGRAEVEEDQDLVALRLAYVVERAALQARGSR